LISDSWVLAVIVVNTAALTVSGFDDRGSQVEQVALWVDMICVGYFVVEAVLKVSAWGWVRYWESGWNRFDFVVVVASLPVLAGPWLDMEGFRVLLLLRLGRLFRLFRVVRMIPNVQHIAERVRRAMQASVGIFFALALTNFVMALGASLLFGQLAPEYFGDPIVSLYTMFKVFTVEGWYEVPDQLVAGGLGPGMANLTRAYFVAAVLIGGVLGLSLANAVFVDAMVMDNTRDLEGQVRELQDKIDLILEEIRSRASTDGGG